MNETAAPEIRQMLSIPPPNSWRTRFRHWVAQFWLNYFFWHACRFPGYTRKTKWFYLWFPLRYSRQIIAATRANAVRILGDKATAQVQEQFTRGVVSSFFDFIADIGRSSNMSREQLAEQIESVEGDEHYKAARKSGKGAIIATAHMGSFEVGLAAVRRHDTKINVVFRRDKMLLFEGLRTRMRERLGVVEAPVDDGWPMWIKLRDALARDEVVVVQCDRVLPGQKGVRVPFCFGHILVPTGPIKLALASGAPIVPIFSVRSETGKVRIFVEPAITVDPNATLVNGLHPALLALVASVEKYVKRFPTQWLVLEHVFCEDTDQRLDANRM